LGQINRSAGFPLVGPLHDLEKDFPLIGTRGFRKQIPNFVVGLFVWGIVFILIGFTQGLPYIDEGAPGPRFMPLLLALFLSLLNIIFWVDVFVLKSERFVTLPRLGQLVRPVLFFLTGLGMAFLWERLGVVATVLLASFFELKFIEGYSWIRAIVVGLSFSLSTWVIFQFILGVPLPTGPFEFLASW
jgi:hypothetical protein